MRYKKILLFCIGTIILTGCTQRAPKQTTIEQSTETISMESTETASVKLIIEPSLETESTEPILTQSTEITEIAPTTKESVETKSELITAPAAAAVEDSAIEVNGQPRCALRAEKGFAPAAALAPHRESRDIQE